jgi:penicillin-binding protein 1B
LRKKGSLKEKNPGRRIPVPTAVLVLSGILAVFAIAVLAFYYFQFSRLIDAGLSGELLRSESRVYTCPKRISVGETLEPGRVLRYLQTAGYSTENRAGATGQIKLLDSLIEVRPSANSFFAGKNALQIRFSRQRIVQIKSLDSGNNLISAEIEPELITELFGAAREKRRPIKYENFSKDLMKAILSAEDKRFFEHPGFDPIRILGAAWADIRRGEKAQGASTITMQVARSFFFSTRREWRRKIKETYMALILEQRFSKEQIFELYANEVYLGNRGSFAIHGFGEAAQAFFGKDVRDLNVAQTCFLAGIIRAPNRYSSADRNPDRAAEARDRVLQMMADNHLLNPAQVEQAKRMPLQIVGGSYGVSLAGHFVDMLKDDLLDRFSELELNSQNYRIYTTLDSDLQLAATASVDWGLKNVDAQLAKKYALWRQRGEDVPLPQAALVAIDPGTGEIKALVGSRDYAKNQLNHALIKRQPGSVFKPFVYAAALETALDDGESPLTPISTVVDEPTTFSYDGREYTPNNYGQEFHGTVTLREALVRSLNVATVKVAQEVGYGRIVALAKRLGLTSDVRATPAMALGAYELTPLEIAAGYTAFAHYGIRSEISSFMRVASKSGDLLQKSALVKKSVMDPRIAYMITNILEDVINHGTGAGVRTRGFRAPAAGKTGTSHDGWFAGYTTNLLCVVWVGFDDNRELGLSGANSAGPIWAEFMKKAVTLPEFSNAQQFERPEGVVSVTIDPETRQLANPQCPVLREEVFIAGTEPTESCTLHPDNPSGERQSN